jgi:GntR family transcriptional repressor for pyruvate dehydrogenase complex
MFKQIKVTRISEEIYEQIKSAIVEGTLRPGEKLPTERELMKELGVSRIPIREALKLLENVGFIRTRQGGGSHVRSLLADRIYDPLNHMVKDDVEKAFELIEVRKEVETWSAYHAARLATAEDRARLSGVIDAMKACFEKGKTPPTRLDMDFHLAIAHASHNTIREHLTHTICDVFSEYFDFLVQNICFNKRYQQTVYDQHLGIYDAIVDQDVEGSKKRIEEHLTFVDRELRRRSEADGG